MFNSHKNKQTFRFGDINPEEINPYAQPARKFVPDYQNGIEEDLEYLDYEEIPSGLKENIPKAALLNNDPKRLYAQQLLDQITLKSQKKAADAYEKEQVLALRQWELQQFREDEERKKAQARQKTKDYREMLELQTQIKKTTQVEDYRSVASEPRTSETRVLRNNRNSPFNPITGEAYELEDPLKPKSDNYKPSDKSLASYGNIVVQSRRPF